MRKFITPCFFTKSTLYFMKIINISFIRISIAKTSIYPKRTTNLLARTSGCVEDWGRSAATTSVVAKKELRQFSSLHTVTGLHQIPSFIYFAGYPLPGNGTYDLNTRPDHICVTHNEMHYELNYRLKYTCDVVGCKKISFLIFPVFVYRKLDLQSDQ